MACRRTNDDSIRKEKMTLQFVTVVRNDISKILSVTDIHNQQTISHELS